MTTRSILITGCSSGIGYDTAHTLHKAGWRVFATCRQVADCERLQSEGLESFPLDYASTESVQAAAQKVLSLTEGQLDALYNNGAYGLPGCVEDVPREAMREVFETNLFGQFELINLVLPAMRKRNTGYIINCSSVLGFAAMPFRGPYNASKFAMEGLTDTLRLELKDTNIHVVLIEPGPITTDIRRKSQPHFEKWIDVENSACKTMYETVLKPRLYAPKGQPDKFELPPSAVTNKIIKALESNRPRPRYYVTTPTWIAGIGKRLLSSRGMDWLCTRH